MTGVRMSVLLLLLSTWICTEVHAQAQTFLVVAPLSFRLDALEKVVVQVFGFSDPQTVYVSLRKTMADNHITQQRVTLSAPTQHMGEVHLRLFPADVDDTMDHVILHVQSDSFQKHMSVPLSRNNGFLVVQTDKPLYTPRQSVKVRAFSLNQELRPADRSVFLTFRDPDYEKVSVVEIKDVSNGMPSLQNHFKIPLNPKLGIWTLEASYMEHFQTKASTTFEVREYVLPTFTILIEPTLNYVSHNNFQSFSFKVSAKYLHGAPVADAEMFLRFGFVSGTSSPVIIPSSVKREVLSSSGELLVSVNLQEIFSRARDFRTLPELKNKNLYIAVLMRERTGGISEEAELQSVKFVQSPYTLGLLSTPPFIKPGLPYYIRVLVKDHLGQPVSRVPVRLVDKRLRRRGRDAEELNCSPDSSSSDTEGIASFSCNIKTDTLTIDLRILTDDRSLPADSQASLPLAAESYDSPNARYLYIDPSPIQTAVGSHTQVTVYSVAPPYLRVRSLNYLIMSKGKVVKRGWIELREEQDSRHTLSFQVTGEMVPSIRLLVYYMPYGESTSELVADAVWLNVRGECVNGLETELKVQGTHFRPQQQLRMDVTVNQDGYIAMAAVDTGIYSLRPNYKDPVDKVLRLLESADQGCGGGGGRNAADVFRLAGLSFMTNANAGQAPSSEPCKALVRPRRALSDEEAQQLLNSFPQGLRSWCQGGLNYSPAYSNCEDYAQTMFHMKPKKCRDAFVKCCHLNQKHGQKNSLGKSDSGGDFDKVPTRVRSHFPESWLWQVKKVTRGSISLSEKLPDSLTTWHIKTVGMFGDGICVAKTAEVSVNLPLSVNIPVPYQIVRGEQIQLSGSVFSQLSDSVKFCVTLTVGPELCLVDSVSASDGSGRRSTSCDGAGRTQTLEAGGVGEVRFTLMALEAGQHQLTFDLITAPVRTSSSLGRRKPQDTLVKRLTVVPEGELYEEMMGGVLDPKGLYGLKKLSVELKSALPKNIVPNTNVQRMLTINGEILDQWVSVIDNPKGLKKLLSLPSGSAESELGGLLIDLHVYNYLEKTRRWAVLGPDIERSSSHLKQRLIDGVSGLSMFKRKDFSYGMFRTHDSSTWVTALAARTLASVNDIVPVDLESLAQSVNWLIRNARGSDGSFRNTTTLYKPNNIMRLPDDNVEKSVYLTAFVAIALHKATKIQDPALRLQSQEDGLNAALGFVSRNINAVRSVYVLSVAAYALTLHTPNTEATIQLLQRLEELSRHRGNPPELMYWQDENIQMEWIKPDQRSGQTVETTAYALLSFVIKGRFEIAKPVVTWLTQDQHYGGGHFSPQGALMTLEAMSQYLQSASGAALDQYIRLQFNREPGLDQEVHLHNTAPVVSPVQISKNSAVTARTALGGGVSHIKLKTVYYRTLPPQENCHFDIKIELLKSVPSDSSLSSPHLVACAQYKPPPNEQEEESLPTVMEITLPSGIEPFLDDLRPLMEGEEPLVASYRLEERTVIVQIYSVPSHQFICVGFRIRSAFVVGGTSDTVFRVYEEQDPGSVCSKQLSDQEQKIQRLCQYDQCQCVTTVCSSFRGTVDPGTVTEERLRQEICIPQIKYAFRVNVTNVESEGDFSTITATVMDVIKRAPDFGLICIGTKVDFIKKTTCNSVDIQSNQQYLIYGSAGLEVEDNQDYRFRFPLDSDAQVQIWPTDCGPECQVLFTFSVSAQINPC